MAEARDCTFSAMSPFALAVIALAHLDFAARCLRTIAFMAFTADFTAAFASVSAPDLTFVTDLLAALPGFGGALAPIALPPAFV